MALVPAVKNALSVVGDHAPQILTGLGIAGFISSTVLAVDATPAAYNKIKAEEYKRVSDGDNRPLTVKDIVGLTWKDYAASAIMIVMSGAMVVGGHYMTAKRYSKQLVAMTAAYEMASQQANKYYEKARQMAGKQKADDIKAAVAQDIVDDIPDEAFENAPKLGGGDWFYETITGQLFQYDYRKFKDDLNEYNYELMTEMWKPVNDLWGKIGLDQTISGKLLGYDVDKGLVKFYSSETIRKGGHAVTVLAPYSEPETRPTSKYY